MARLEAIEKSLYYPTQKSIVPLIARHIVIDHYGDLPPQGAIFDPCIGKGEAVEQLVKLLPGQWAVHGIELHEERAALARQRFGGAIHQGDARGFLIEGWANILFLNPPYDTVNGKHLEIEFLDQTLNGMELQNRGLLIYIIPDKFVTQRKPMQALKSAIVRNKLYSVKIYRYPDPVYSEFKQVVLFARRRNSAFVPEPNLDITGTLGESLEPIDYKTWSEMSYYDERKEKYDPLWLHPGEPDHPMELIKVFDEPAEGNYVMARPLQDILGNPEEGAFAMRPLMPMGPEHAALVTAAGMLNGIKIGNMIIRGSTFKKLVVKETEKENDKGDKITERIEIEVLIARLTWLDLQSGKVTSINNDQHTEQFNEMLLAHAQEFVDTAKNLYPPLWTPDDKYDFSWIHSPTLLGDKDVGLLPPQEKVAGALVKGWRSGQKTLTLVGEMATGKTTTSIAATAFLARGRKSQCQKIVVMTPAKNDLVDKWVEETKNILRDANAYVTRVDSLTELHQAMERQGLVVVVMKETTAKASSPWKRMGLKPWKKYTKGTIPNRSSPFGDQVETLEEGISLLKEKPDTPGHVVIENDGKPYAIHRDKIMLCPNPDCEEQIDWNAWHEANRKRYVHHCGEPLWTFTYRYSSNGHKKRMKPKYPLARYLRDHYGGQYILIMDEAHNFKAGDSNRGYASTDLISGAYKAILMTGTIFGGKASTIFHLLYRSLPAFRDLYEHRDEQSFVNAHGLFKKITRSYPEYSGDRVSGYKEYSGNASERPGMDPGMVAWLLPNAAFLALRDFDFAMPDYSEHTLFVEPDDHIDPIYGALEALKEEGVKQWKDGHGKSLLSQWQWARFGMWDCPTLPEFDYIPLLPEGYISPKEKAFLRLIYQQKLAGRRVLCYVTQIGKRDPTPRLIGLLEKYGMKGTTMYQNIKNRLEFIRKHLAYGCDVIFTNPALVAEGINIIECPTIIWLQHDFNIYRMPQANRRPYRFTQTKPVKIFYLAFNETPQAEAFSYIAEKLAAQQALQGDIKNGLAALETERDFVSELQDQVSSQKHFESDLSIDDLPELPEPNGIQKEKIILELPKVELANITIATTANGQMAFF